MKKRTKLIIGLIAASAGCCIMAACSTDNSPYGDFNMPTVHFDPNGGQFASTDYVTMTDAYPYEQAVKGVKLLEPGDEVRGEKVWELSAISRSGYFLAGWYKERALRTDENGNPLDEDGNLCSVSGKEQGYSYSGRWDFENDLFTVKNDWQYAEGEYTLTLYAAWIPDFSYAFYEETENGWAFYNTYSFNPMNTPEDMAIGVPSLDGDGVAMEYSTKFPQSSGKTFTAAYADADKTEACGEVFSHRGVVDLEHGVSVNGITACYTTWKAGVWFNIYTAEQFLDKVRTDGCYDIKADLDFTELSWSAGLARGSFTGQIVGNGHVFSNISVMQTEVAQTYGGLFGRIAAEAVIKDVSFLNVTYILAVGSRLNPSSFGLFAGELAPNATVENVNVTGTLQIGNIYRTADYGTYNIGELIGNSTTREIEGITYSITCGRYEEGFPEGVTKLNFIVDETTGQISIQVVEN